MTETKEVYMETEVNGKPFVFRVPQCCVEGRPDCPHGVPKVKPKKRKNIAV